jgi:hypothetical protein
LSTFSLVDRLVAGNGFAPIAADGGIQTSTSRVGLSVAAMRQNREWDDPVRPVIVTGHPTDSPARPTQWWRQGESGNRFFGHFGIDFGCAILYTPYKFR